MMRVSGNQISVDNSLQEFIEVLHQEYLGGLIDVNISHNEPLQLYSTVQQDESGVARPIYRDAVIRDIIVYTNSICRQSCVFCARAHQQFTCCGEVNSQPEVLKFQYLERFVGELATEPTSLTFSGGDIFSYQHIEKLLDLLSRNPRCGSTTFCGHFLNVPMEQRQLIKLSQCQIILKMIIPWSFDENGLATRVAHINDFGLEAESVFVVKDQIDINRAVEVASKLRTTKVSLRPYYDGGNDVFFRDQVFLDLQTLLDPPPTLFDIQANSVLNRLCYGTFVVLSNGDICENVSMPPIGNIHNCTMREAATREINGGGAWFTTRNGVAPCRDCVFQNLCPPLSAYEYALGRNNLCHIWESSKAHHLQVAGAQLHRD